MIIDSMANYRGEKDKAGIKAWTWTASAIFFNVAPALVLVVLGRRRGLLIAT